MCVPGPVTSYTSQGVNNCLRQGRGTVVTHGAEVLELIGAARASTSSTTPRGEQRPRDGSPRPSSRAGVGSGQRVRRGSTRSHACAGSHSATTEGALRRLRSKGFVQLTDEGVAPRA